MIEDTLSEEILKGNINKADNLIVKVENGQLKITKKEEHAI
jgi:ATP-dependent Clp protease ATP-binding subunit ClpA